jgi:hypothetical protein
VSLERGGVLPEGALGPTACWAGPWLWFVIDEFVLRFYYFTIMGFSPVMRGPLWLSPTVAPEPLRWYPLGTRIGWRLLIGLSSVPVAMSFHGGALADPRV